MQMYAFPPPNELLYVPLSACVCVRERDKENKHSQVKGYDSKHKKSKTSNGLISKSLPI